MNWLGGSLLILYVLGVFIICPILVLIFHASDPLDQYGTFLHQIFSSVLLIFYIISQGKFRGMIECFSGIAAVISQILVGYSMSIFLFNNWNSISVFERDAGILCLIVPVLICYALISFIVSLFFFLFWGSFTWVVDIFRKDRFKEFKKQGNKAHVIITGGGTGLGATTAAVFARMGTGNITVLSRNITHLNTVVETLKAVARYPDDQHFYALVGDVTKLEELTKSLTTHISTVGVPDLVICCAGLSRPGYFLEMPPEVFTNQINLNYLGCVNTCRAVIPPMLTRQSPSLLGHSFTKSSHMYKGEVCLVSSALGVMGSIGYSAYCPSKYAVRGLSECLRQEYAPQGLDISCFYPSNMKTEGYIEEMKTKPEEARIVDEQASTISPEVGTRKLLEGISRGQFHIATEWLIDCMRELSNGISPSGTPVIEYFIHPALHFIGRTYRIYMDYICESVANNRRKKKIMKNYTSESSKEKEQ